MKITLFEGADATTAAPTLATDGKAIVKRQDSDAAEGFREGTDEALLVLQGTADAATAGSITVRLWGYTSLGGWTPLGVNATPDSKGVINAVNAIGETGDDIIAHSEVVQKFDGFARIYAQIVAAANLDSVDCYLLSRGPRVVSGR